MAVLRKCVCCGKEYEYCPNCSKSNKPAWMVTFCSERCKDLFNIVSAYNMKLIGKAKVQAFVTEHSIDDFSHFNNSIRKVLEEACRGEVSQIAVVPSPIPVPEPVVKEEAKIPVEAPVLEENKDVEKAEKAEEKKESVAKSRIIRRRKKT